MRILLVEPNYRSKFPPLGLLRISSFFKRTKNDPQFVIGKNRAAAKQHWDRIFISSLFTFELPRTIATINYYENSVTNPNEEIIVGGVGATLMPEFIRQNALCKVITGPLCNANMLGFGEEPIAYELPDYSLLPNISKKYTPDDAYFTRVTSGCIRTCAFCAVPVLEPKFRYLQSITEQVSQVRKEFGERHDLVVLDNNILALDNFNEVIEEIKELGFAKGATLNKRKRRVDFNQGIDVRLITADIARKLSSIAVKPVRIAFDHISTEQAYRTGVKFLAEAGIGYITTYVMFNFKDTPEEFYRRLEISLELNKQYNIRITGFPMRYCPINNTDRHYISRHWNWRYLRGIQCILAATHGMVSPNPGFFRLAFGNNADEFKKIISMPDDLIIYRRNNRQIAQDWGCEFDNLNAEDKLGFYDLLEKLHSKSQLEPHKVEKFASLLNYYEKR